MVYYIRKYRINQLAKQVIKENHDLLSRLNDDPIVIWQEADGYRARYYDEERNIYCFNDIPEPTVSKLFDWKWQ